jgi:hypothetical protein
MWLAAAETNGGGALFWTVLLIVTVVGAIVNGSFWFFGRSRFSDYRINRLRIATLGLLAWVALDIARLLLVS